MKKFDAVIIGELNIDLVLWGVPLPEYEKEKLAQDMRFTMGSSSAITAYNLAALGTRVAFIGKAGADTFGDFMVRELSKGGVDTSAVIRDKTLKTGATIVLANPPKKALLTYLGAMAYLTIEDIDWDVVREARHLHVGGFFLQTGLRKDVGRIFARAREMGLTTSLDTNWDPDEQWGDDLREALRFTDIFLPNEEEAVQIAQTSTVEEALERLGEIVPVVVIKQGKKGASLRAGDTRLFSPGFEVEVVETTGAGDSFNAGFLHQYLKGKSWEECLRFGNLCGALAVTAMGGTGAFADKDQIKLRMEAILGRA
ncbi:MAG: sugar kinase [candidate division KSB1 bacterium]|nr:sugar kinase [candidate division KSB1 bacterium]